MKKNNNKIIELWKIALFRFIEAIKVTFDVAVSVFKAHRYMFVNDSALRHQRRLLRHIEEIGTDADDIDILFADETDQTEEITYMKFKSGVNYE